jgi:peptidyl-tRNA hydrolase, PTH2 family
MSLPETDYKQVIIVRKDLNMRKGKIAAQAAHGAMSFLTRGPEVQVELKDNVRRLEVVLDEDAYLWILGRFRKICVYVTSEKELLELHEKAISAGLRSSLVLDSGKTEFSGVPTHTVVCIGPHSNEKIDPITGHLPPL